MELAERLLSVPERENAGARSSNRFTYQQVWAFDYIQYNTYYDRQINK